MTFNDIYNEFFKDYHVWHEQNPGGIPEVLDWKKFENMTRQLVREQYGFSDKQFDMVVTKVGAFDYKECYLKFTERVVRYCDFLKTFNEVD